MPNNVKAGCLWVNQDKLGRDYMNGVIEYEQIKAAYEAGEDYRIVCFTNGFKDENPEKNPDWIIYKSEKYTGGAG